MLDWFGKCRAVVTTWLELTRAHLWLGQTVSMLLLVAVWCDLSRGEDGLGSDYLTST